MLVLKKNSILKLIWTSNPQIPDAIIKDCMVFNLSETKDRYRKKYKYKIK